MRPNADAIGVNDEECRRLAANLYNYVWSLLDRATRTPVEDEAMINAAHASRFFWGAVGTPVNLTRGEWQLARVYVNVGRLDAALAHAQTSLEICLVNEIVGFDLAFAHEGLARVKAMLGDREAAAQHRTQAERIAMTLSDLDDRELLLNDIATLPV